MVNYYLWLQKCNIVSIIILPASPSATSSGGAPLNNAVRIQSSFLYKKSSRSSTDGRLPEKVGLDGKQWLVLSGSICISYTISYPVSMNSYCVDRKLIYCIMDNYRKFQISNFCESKYCKRLQFSSRDNSFIRKSHVVALQVLYYNWEYLPEIWLFNPFEMNVR